ncbi:hypothetical protein BMS3Bbin15_01204 [archaeon BMS3Bbin15]|nr:hypothetical protein BMS3Bbin15_01204 [archaeon BMS3Bbin15]
MVRKVINILILVVAIVLIYFYWHKFLSLADTTLKYLKNIILKYVLLAFFVYLAVIVVIAARWKTILGYLDYKFKTVSLVPIIFGTVPINNLTPANRMGGEPLRILWVKEKFGVPYTPAIMSILFERLSEAIPGIILIGFTLYFMVSFFQLDYNPTRILKYLLIVLLFMSSVFYIFRTKLKSLRAGFGAYSTKLRPALVPALLYSIFIWVLDATRLKLIAMSFGVPISFKLIIIVTILYIVLGAIPLTPGGLGFVEGGVIPVLSAFGIPLGVAIGMVVVERFISYFLGSIIGLFFLLHFGGLKIWKNKG